MTLLAKAAGAWSRYFFTPAAATDLAFSRAAFCTLAFLYYLPQDFSEWGTVAREFWMPIPLFAVSGIPLLSAGALSALQIVFKVALALAAVGLFTRLALVVAFGCSVYLLGLPQNFGQIQHFDTLVVLVFGILAMSRAGDAWSIDAWRRWGNSTGSGPSRAPSMDDARPVPEGGGSPGRSAPSG